MLAVISEVMATKGLEECHCKCSSLFNECPLIELNDSDTTSPQGGPGK